MSQTTKLADAPQVKETREQFAAAERALAAAQESYRKLAPGAGNALQVNLTLLRLEEDLARKRSARDELRRQVEAVERSARAAIIEARRPGRRQLLERLIATSKAAHAAAIAVERYDQATAADVELLPSGHPAPVLLGSLADAITQLDRELAGPQAAPAAAPPPRSGEVRLKLLGRVGDIRNFRFCLPGDVADFSADIAADLLKRRLAVAVESA